MGCSVEEMVEEEEGHKLTRKSLRGFGAILKEDVAAAAGLLQLHSPIREAKRSVSVFRIFFSFFFFSFNFGFALKWR